MSSCPKVCRETRQWLKELKKKGIKEFEFKNLPEDLKIKRRIHECSYAGLIKKIGKKRGHNVWRLL